MDYKEYTTEYEKLILKQQLKRNISTKKIMMSLMKSTDSHVDLGMLLSTNDLDGQILENEKMLEMAQDDIELQQLLNESTTTIKELKSIANNRMNELQVQSQEKDDFQHSYKEESNNLMSNDSYNTPYLNNFFKEHEKIGDDPEQFIVQFMKQSISNRMDELDRIMNTINEETPLEYLEQLKKNFGNQGLTAQYALSIQGMPNCDSVLGVLSDSMARQAQTIESKVNEYIEKINQRGIENGEHTQEGLKDWELSPEKRNQIQLNSAQTAQEYNQRQINPRKRREDSRFVRGFKINKFII